MVGEEQEAEQLLLSNWGHVRARVQALSARGVETTLIAVSKTKPNQMILTLQQNGQQHFGENYVQELLQKARTLPQTIRWHFIGHLQTNKVKEILQIPNLECIHTVDSMRLADEIHKRASTARAQLPPLNVMVQVNTSGEDSKSGCTPNECMSICKHLRDSCSTLCLCGLMCIGKYSADEGGASEDFACLVQCRKHVAHELGLDESLLCLSMGMSHDFEDAIRAGATHVRVGSTIFGARARKV